MQPGARVGNCEVLRELARGGQGVVYEARDLATGQPRAIKVLLEDDDEMRARFRHEARALANLDHPGLPRVFDLQERDGAFYMVQELIAGQDLQSLVRAGSLEPVEAVEIVLSLAETLDYVHAQGLVHRDLKPGNVVLERGTGRVVLLDFGMIRTRLRQAWATRDRASLTGEGEVLGTPAFMAPEQIDRTIGEIDRRTDVYALGGTLFMLLTGSAPFAGATVLDLLDQVLSVAPPNPRDLNARVPPHVADTCLRCLAKAPVARPASAGAVAALLQAAPAPGGSARLLRWLALAAAIPALLSLGAAGYWALGPAPQPAPAPSLSPSQAPSRPRLVSAETSSPTPSPSPSRPDPGYLWRKGQAVLVSQEGGATPAVKLFEAAGELGVVGAMNEAGRLYEQGLGVRIDHRRAYSWFERSAETGDLVGLARQGFSLVVGRGVSKDIPRGEELLKRAGEHPEALYRWGLYVEWVQRDAEGAFVFYERSARGGHGDAYSRVGHLLSTGGPEGLDYAKAFRCYEEGTRLGSCHAIHGLARLLTTKIPGRVQDPERALELYERSARLGVRDSSVNLASAYLRLNRYEAARGHAERALSLGQGIGAIFLAEIYFGGRLGRAQPRKAWEALLEGVSGEREYGRSCAGYAAEKVRLGRLPPEDLVEDLWGALEPYRRSRDARLRRDVTEALQILRR
jgi:serine/threonine protein kinase/tetratricopeptide (TPR) repeat protein